MHQPMHLHPVYPPGSVVQWMFSGQSGHDAMLGQGQHGRTTGHNLRRGNCTLHAAPSQFL